MTLSCIAPRCAIPRHHVPGCDATDCRGCLPALAEVGRLCTRCLQRTNSTLTDIAELTARLPSILARGQRGGQRVTGTPEQSAPINIDAHDLADVYRLSTIHDEWHDQTGQLSVATILETWIRDWRDSIGPHERLPEPEPADQVAWLKTRLEWAAKHHTAADEFITAVSRLRSTLLVILSENEPDPEPVLGVPCKRCDQRNLYRRTDGSGDVDCHTCGRILRRDELDEWTRLITAPQHRRWLKTVGTADA